MTEAEREKARDERKRRAKADQQRRDDALRAVMSSKQGRDFVARCIYDFGALKKSSVHSNPNLRDIHQGQRAVGAALEREVMRAARPEWQLMEQERTERLTLEPVEPVIEPEEDGDE